MNNPPTMRAMVLTKQREPLVLKELPVRPPGEGEILIKVHACGVCRTDLHICDGELTSPKLPLVLGHEIVGEVIDVGSGVHTVGGMVGVPWLGYTCGKCKYCIAGKENLCNNARFTGYTVDGGYAEYTTADHRFCFPLKVSESASHSAPLLCAGLIGYRSYTFCGESAKRIGIYGFGAAAHIIAQIAVHDGKEVYAFTKRGDKEGQKFAMTLGAVWTGSSDELPPVKLDASIIFAPAGALVPSALKATDKGGIVVCGGIHMSNIPEFEYSLLWEERSVKSVANLTREDGIRLLEKAPKVPVKTKVQVYPLEKANEALEDLRNGNVHGAAVLKIV